MRPEEGTMQSRAHGDDRIVELLIDQPVIICNGFPSREAQKIADRPTHFYMIGSMGSQRRLRWAWRYRSRINKSSSSTAMGTSSWAWGPSRQWGR